MATIVGIIYVTGGTRKLPIQHAKRQVGGRMQAATSSFLPFKVNTAGVMPIIFAISILMFPATIAGYFIRPDGSAASRFATGVRDFFQPGHSHVASLLYAGLILAFTYFYAAITMNIPELAENLKKYGSFIPGIRPGRPTQEYPGPGDDSHHLRGRAVPGRDRLHPVPTSRRSPAWPPSRWSAAPRC